MSHAVAMNLFERWRETAAANGSELALRDGDHAWTFNELQREVEALPPATGPVLPSGRSFEFVLGILQAWRDRQIAVPLEGSSKFDSVRARLNAAPKGIVHVKTTSGSTGAPRYILFTSEQLAADAAHIVSTMGLRREWPNLGVISLAHSYGFANLVLPLLLHGIPLILVPDPLPETMRRTLAACASNGVTIAAVPAMWRTWIAANALSADRVKLAISAGAPLSLKLERAAFESCGVKIHNFLGASECGGIAYDRTSKPRASGSQWIGSALDGVSLGVDETGALIVKSAAAGQSYWPLPDSALKNGEFRSSDLVRLENRDVYLLGRADDVINVSGRKVHPDEIERWLSAEPGVLHAAVFGVPSAQSGRTEDIVAVVSLEEGAEISSVKGALAQVLPEWKIPRRWEVNQGLLPDKRGKISRAHWKSQFLGR